VPVIVPCCAFAHRISLELRVLPPRRLDAALRHLGFSRSDLAAELSVGPSVGPLAGARAEAGCQGVGVSQSGGGATAEGRHVNLVPREMPATWKQVHDRRPGAQHCASVNIEKKTGVQGTFRADSKHPMFFKSACACVVSMPQQKVSKLRSRERLLRCLKCAGFLGHSDTPSSRFFGTRFTK